MEKLIYLVWDRPSRSGADVRAQLLDEIAPKLLACSPRGLQMDLDDDEAQVRSMVPIPGDELPLRALVSIWVDAHDTRAQYEEVLAAVGIRRAGYLVTESLYRDYGDNEHAAPRDWAEALAEELLRRQHSDGSWVNDAVEVREDDPLVATPLAAGALAVCRDALSVG